MKRPLLAPALLLVLGTACNKPQNSPATPTPPTVPPLALQNVVLAGEVPTTLTTFDAQNSPLRAFVNRLNIDAQDRIWACASVAGGESPVRGLAYFDGRTWTSVTRARFPELPVVGTWAYDVAFDSQGTTWIAAAGGLVRWRGTQAVIFPQGGSMDVGSGFSGSVQQVALDKQPDRVWFQYQQGGIGLFTGTAFERYLPGQTDETGRRVVVDDQGTVWFGVNGLARLRNGERTVYGGVAFGLPFNDAPTLTPVPGGGVWFTGGTLRQVLRFDGTTFTGFDLGSILARETTLTALRTDAAGRLYLGTSAGTVFRMTPDGRAQRLASLPGASAINDLAIAAQGTVWASQKERLVQVQE